MTHVKIQEDAGWLMPSGLIALFVALSSFLWLLADIVLSRPLLCDIEDQHVRALAIIAGGGGACLAASMARTNIPRFIIGVISGIAAGLGAAAVVALLYGLQCTPFQMYLRQLFSS